MTDQPENQADELEGNPEALGHSFGNLLEKQAWEVDGDLGKEYEGDASNVSPGADAPGSPDAGFFHPEPSSPPALQRIIEAMLFVGGTPLTFVRASDAIKGLTEEQFSQAIDALNQDYRRQGRPYAIQTQEQGQFLTLRSRYQPVLEKLYGGVREARLSLAAVDTLALVAYRQPAAKQEIDAIRGMDSGALLRQLVRRGLIAVVHRGEAGNREVRYGTTRRFLDLFGLSSLDDLPQTQDLQQL